MNKIIHIRLLSELKNRKSELNFIKNCERFIALFEKIQLPVTLFIEEFYSDRDYKDAYYHFFASKYNEFPKYATRIAIFEGIISKDELYSKKYSLQEKLIGVIIIRPILNGCIGRTYFDPSKLRNECKMYVRTTPFKIGILGRQLEINTFPFSSQDGEYMTCAETSLWMLLYYYGTRYGEYRTALPHEIIDIVDDKHFQRVVPSVGLHYTQSSEVLKRFGFSSQVYIRLVKDKIYYDDRHFKRLFYYYIESGIPIMVGVRFKQKNKISDEEVGHAAVCIGHGEVMVDDESEPDDINGFKVFNSADFVNTYIYMDDNKYPFKENHFDNFDYNEFETKIKYLIVPLYKRIFLDALMAEKTFYAILKNDFFGLSNIFDLKDKVLVLRIFLTTSRNYKSSRFESLEHSYKIIDSLPMPKFVWICEISTLDLYRQNKIIGEIVLDPTSSKNEGFKQIILIRYPNKFAYKTFSEQLQQLIERFKKKRILEDVYSAFNKNLVEV